MIGSMKSAPVLSQTQQGCGTAARHLRNSDYGLASSTGLARWMALLAVSVMLHLLSIASAVVCMKFRQKRLALALCLAAGIGTHAAQQPTTPAAPTGTGTIVGTVIDAATGEPVPSATVTVIVAGTAGGRAVQSSRTVNERGQFTFDEVSAGTLTVRVSRPGYSGMYYGDRSSSGAALQGLELAQGETIAGLVVRLWKNAFITGTVRDANGEPLVREMVRAATVTIVGGRKVIGYGPWAVTDDRGEYRISDIPPKEYALVLVSPTSRVPSTTPLPAAQSPEAAARVGPRYAATGFRTVFYPDALLSSAATLFTLRGGEERTGMDLRTVRGASFSVSGTVSGSDAGYTTPIQITLRPADPSRIVNIYDQQNVLADASGRFTFVGVASGQYTIETVVTPTIPEGAFRYEQLGIGNEMHVPFGRFSTSPLKPALWARTELTVGDADVNTLVTLHPGARIVGRVMFDGAAQPSAETLASMALAAETTDGRQFGPMTASAIRADGTFETAGLPPGPYWLMPMGALGQQNGWSLISTEIEGRPSTGRAIVVGASDVNVMLRFGTQPPHLTGTVKGEDGRPAPDATVYVFSTDRETWANSRDGGTTAELTPGPAGVFRATLAPGEYYVVPARAAVRDDWRRTIALDALSKTATRVTLRLGQNTSIDVVVR